MDNKDDKNNVKTTLDNEPDGNIQPNDELYANIPTDDALYAKESVLRYSTQRYTYADYASWDDENRYELIDGQAYLMSAPSMAHQKISGALHNQLYNFLKGKPCEVFYAPFDVCLFGLGDYDYTVVQPDLLVICDMSKLDDRRCNGAPDMAIEILSPSNRRHDTVLKFNKYLQAGVREYWIVDPEAKSVQVHTLVGGGYTTTTFDENQAAPVHVIDGLWIDLKEVFNF